MEVSQNSETVGPQRYLLARKPCAGLAREFIARYWVCSGLLKQSYASYILRNERSRSHGAQPKYAEPCTLAKPRP